MFRIKEKMSWDSPSIPYWVVEKTVIGSLNLQLPGIYASKESAEKEVARLEAKEGA